MPCRVVNAGGMTAIVCGGPRRPATCSCGRAATLACDWRIGKGSARGRCDEPICAACTTSPAPGKDLCPRHAQVWAVHPSNPAKDPKVRPRIDLPTYPPSKTEKPA